MARIALTVLLVAALAGCSSAGRKSFSKQDAYESASAGGSAAVAGATVPTTQAGPKKGGPNMEPKRVIAEQDCSKAIDFYKGNLRCK